MQNETNQHEVIEVRAIDGIPTVKKKYHKRSYSILEKKFVFLQTMFSFGQ